MHIMVFQNLQNKPEYHNMKNNFEATVMPKLASRDVFRLELL